ncbi:MAG: ABC transporter substrate-binding protein [bacterium]|nr:ABC transporter substrate-binding protein [bacterium]
MNNNSLNNNNGTNSKLILSIFSLVIVGISSGIFLGWILSNTSSKSLSTKEATNTTSKALNNTPFKIGFVTPLSGDGASYGVPAKHAAEVIIQEINEKGGFGGRKVELYFEDGNCSSVDAKVAGEKLINQIKVDLLYGGECSDEFLAVAPLAQEKKIITISASATNPKIAELGKYIFRTIPSDNLAGKAAAQYAKNKFNASSSAVIYENTSYAVQLNNVYTKEYEKLGGKVVLATKFDTGETDFSSFIKDIKQNNPEVIYVLPQTPTPGVLIVKALKDSGIKANLLTAEVLLTRDEVQKQGEILDNIVGIETSVDENKPKAKAISDKYKKTYSQNTQYPTDLLAINDLFYIYKEAYEKVGSNTDKISEYFHNLKDWDGAAGKITFDKNGDIISLPYDIKLIKDKKVTLIETFTVAQ